MTIASVVAFVGEYRGIFESIYGRRELIVYMNSIISFRILVKIKYIKCFSGHLICGTIVGIQFFL
jgi:hypothetical protein